jgi:fumarylacetoacetate (FAA) hydrolase
MYKGIRRGSRFGLSAKDNMSHSKKTIDLKSDTTSLRDFYAFEQHVKTCRAHRGLEMVPQWYQVPVFYFSNPVAIIGDGDSVWAPQGSAALDYELELACIIGSPARNLTADDSAMGCVAG